LRHDRGTETRAGPCARARAGACHAGARTRRRARAETGPGGGPGEADNKAVLTMAATDQLDREVVVRFGEFQVIQIININGHADRLGSAQYNQKLSERRAETVKAYLVKQGAPADKVETYGYGKTLPVKACPDQKDRKALIECLQPNRRVEVEVQGTARP
jgi:OmpA-OmpF porin, OOP family